MEAVHRSFPFSSTCPKCSKLRRQHGFSRGALLALLEHERAILAYCSPCDEHWPISSEQRQWIVGALEASKRLWPLA
jgi:hypothetical protein